ncbi:hypothetical protein BO86DRAFT_403261 [Aspergillus japonicus CBS 114.51]|uniref:Uncharacterized protein n=1 Tax=Aspergillus japonicus CBS 114.51 TaxID=1448312 RepID=A0A8T8WR84_ASPJA|nr:hypothetical protein BO86DRAFT_403261 [Aspergillus japonicus CBS 114.51]RAH77839.1 hypothetical protein BO86DRAFT_403261 [Aspergillus japonicus CBS 114.51]
MSPRGGSYILHLSALGADAASPCELGQIVTDPLSPGTTVVSSVSGADLQEKYPAVDVVTQTAWSRKIFQSRPQTSFSISVGTQPPRTPEFGGFMQRPFARGMHPAEPSFGGLRYSPSGRHQPWSSPFDHPRANRWGNDPFWDAPEPGNHFWDDPVPIPNSPRTGTDIELSSDRVEVHCLRHFPSPEEVKWRLEDSKSEQDRDRSSHWTSWLSSKTTYYMVIGVQRAHDMSYKITEWESGNASSERSAKEAGSVTIAYKLLQINVDSSGGVALTSLSDSATADEVRTYIIQALVTKHDVTVDLATKQAANWDIGRGSELRAATIDHQRVFGDNVGLCLHRAIREDEVTPGRIPSRR